MGELLRLTSEKEGKAELAIQRGGGMCFIEAICNNGWL